YLGPGGSTWSGCDFPKTAPAIVRKRRQRGHIPGGPPPRDRSCPYRPLHKSGFPWFHPYIQQPWRERRPLFGTAPPRPKNNQRQMSLLPKVRTPFLPAISGPFPILQKTGDL